MTKKQKTDVWMPLFIGDYLADTTHMDASQHGAYLLLMMAYWKNGPLKDNDGQLMMASRSTPEQWASHLRPVLAELFTIADGFWHHGRIDTEKVNAAERLNKSGTNNVVRWGGDDAAERGRGLRSKRMAEARLKGTHTASEWEAMQRHHGGICCRCKESGEIVKDHIKPIYQGGSDAIENIQPLCRKCNASKGPEDTDHRFEGWHVALKNASAEATECLRKASSSPSPSPIKTKSDSAGARSETQTHANPAQLSKTLRDFSIASNPSDPRLMALAAQGISTETMKAACETAREAKGASERIAPGYVFAILESWAKQASEGNARGAQAPGQSKGNFNAERDNFRAGYKTGPAEPIDDGNTIEGEARVFGGH